MAQSSLLTASSSGVATANLQRKKDKVIDYMNPNTATELAAVTKKPNSLHSPFPLGEGEAVVCSLFQSPTSYYNSKKFESIT